MNPFVRPTYDPDGRVVARRALPMGERTYQPGQELSAADREELMPRLGAFYDQGLVDTLPRNSPPQGKPQQKR